MNNQDIDALLAASEEPARIRLMYATAKRQHALRSESVAAVTNAARYQASEASTFGPLPEAKQFGKELLHSAYGAIGTSAAMLTQMEDKAKAAIANDPMLRALSRRMSALPAGLESALAGEPAQANKSTPPNVIEAEVVEIRSPPTPSDI